MTRSHVVDAPEQAPLQVPARWSASGVAVRWTLVPAAGSNSAVHVPGQSMPPPVIVPPPPGTFTLNLIAGLALTVTGTEIGYVRPFGMVACATTWYVFAAAHWCATVTPSPSPSPKVQCAPVGAGPFAFTTCSVTLWPTAGLVLDMAIRSV